MLDLLKNKPFVAQMVGLLFAIAAMLGLALPAGFDKESVLAVVMLVISAVTIVWRYSHEGAPDAGDKAWWASRTIWTAIIAALFGILGLFKIAPPLDQEGALNTVMLILSVVGVIFGAKAKSALG